MNGIVLGAGPQLTVFGRLGTLQAFYHLHTHHTRQVGILAISLLSPAPSRVAEDIYVGRPHRQTMELLILTRTALHALIILSTELRRSHVKTLVEQTGIKRRCHRHWLWEYGDITLIGSAMQSLTPPEELLDTQSWNGRTLVQHQHGLLLQRQSRTQVLGTFFGTQIGILVR